MSEVSGVELFQSINYYIGKCASCTTHDELQEPISKLERLLQAIPLRTLNDEQFAQLMTLLLTFCQKALAPNVMIYIIDFFDEIKTSDLPVVTDLFRMRSIPDNILQFVANNYQYTYSDYIMDLSTFGSDGSMYDEYVTCMTLERILGVQDVTVYSNLLKYIDNKQAEGKYVDKRVFEYLSNKVHELGAVAKPQEWVRDCGLGLRDPGSQIPYTDQLKIPQPPEIIDDVSDEELVIRLTDGLKLNGLSDDAIVKYREELMAALKQAPVARDLREQDDIIRQRRSRAREPELIQLFGPCHQRIGLDYSEDSRCTRYGGCRMLLCNEFEQYDVDDGFTVGSEKEWFTGKCAYHMCDTPKIENYWQAVRIPLRSGGWKGCYCRFEHALQHVDPEDTIMVPSLIDYYRSQLMNFGLQDRIERPPESETEEDYYTDEDGGYYRNDGGPEYQDEE